MKLDSVKAFPFSNFDESIDIVNQVRRIIYSNGGHCLMRTREMAMLYEIGLDAANDNPDNLPGPPSVKYFIECGTYHGGSAMLIACALKEMDSLSLLLTIDMLKTDTSVSADRTRVVQDSLREFGVYRRVAITYCWDLSFLRGLPIFPIQYVLLDSDHTYDHVKQQLNLVIPRLARGGWCVVHDYRKEYKDAVVKAVDEYFENIKSEFDMFNLEPYNNKECGLIAFRKR